MGQVDSLAADTLVYGLSNVAQNDGWNIFTSGLTVVFGGLILIAFTIFLFNKLSDFQNRKKSGPSADAATQEKVKVSEAFETIPEDHLVAISAAVELYKRLYLGTLESTVTFERGETNSNWKTGSRYGQRKSLR